MENRMTQSNFPDELVPDEVKASPEWGLAVANAIWRSNNKYSHKLFYNGRQTYQENLEYAFGMQSEDMYKPGGGINPSEAQPDKTSINWQIKNYATKRVNAVVARVFNRKYDPVVSAIDELSLDAKNSFQSKLKIQSMYNDILKDLGVQVDGVPQDLIPMDNDDIEVYMQNSYKTNDEIDLEMGVAHLLRENDYEDSVRYPRIFDKVVHGVGCEWNGMMDGFPTTLWRNPAKTIVPWSEDQGFKRIKYAAYVDEYTVDEFRKLHGGTISEEEEARIINMYVQNSTEYNYSIFSNDGQQFGDVDKIAIMHYEYKTTNEHVFLQLKDRAGQTRVKEKGFNYYRGKEDELEKKFKGERKIIRKPWSAVYSGYWILGTDVVIGHDLKKYNTGELGYKVDAPNMREGMTVSLVEQMKPSINLIQTYSRKLQQEVAAAIPKGHVIDIAALRKVKFKMGGKELKETDLVELFQSKGRLLMDSSGYFENAGDTKRPIEELQNGLSPDVITYANLIADELATLDEIIGMNAAVLGGQLNPRQGKATTEYMVASTETTIDHIHQSDRRLTQKSYKELAELYKSVIVYGDSESYEKIFGKMAITRMKDSFYKYDHALDLEARPTDAEWNEFYMELNDLTKQGKLEPEDKIAIRRINNLKQAESLMRVLTKKRKREAMESAMMNAEMNAKAQQESAVMANQGKIEIEKIKGEYSLRKIDSEIRLEKVKHALKMKELLAVEKAKGDEKLDQIALQAELNEQQPEGKQ